MTHTSTTTYIECDQCGVKEDATVIAEILGWTYDALYDAAVRGEPLFCPKCMYTTLKLGSKKW